jgi:hypothetical protein
METSSLLHTLATESPAMKPGTHEIGGWLLPTASLDILEKRKISDLYQDTNPGLSSPLSTHYTDYAITFVL